jgi:hypothetical protein
MIALNTEAEDSVKKEMIELSKINPDKYIYATACFGLFATVEKSLNIHAPGDSYFDWYVLNGKVKQFTNSQKIADENTTPMLS